MKAAFFHDTWLVHASDNKIYSERFSYSIWKRYLSVFDTLIVSTRISLDESTIKKKDLATGDNVQILPISEYEKNIHSLTRRRKIRKQVRDVLRKSDCAVIRLPSIIGFIAYKEAINLNKPYLIEVVGCAWDAFWNHSLMGKLIALPSYIMMKNIVKNSKYNVYVTSDFLQKRYPSEGKNTNCSNVALTEFDEKVLENRLRTIEDKGKTDKIVIGTTAAVNIRYKGQQYVIQALGKLKKQGITNYEYHLVGGGNQTYLKEIAEKNDVIDQVRFLGPMSHNNVFEWLQTIDLYVQPSRQEGLPRALIEAMSRAIPAFGARTGGIPELLEEKFIFSNTRKNIDEIIEILKTFDKETMINQAKRNYEKSKKYEKNVIEARRRKFFEDFKRERKED